VALGRVLGAHGLRGEIRVRVLGDHPGHLCRAKRVWLSGSSGAAIADRVAGEAGRAQGHEAAPGPGEDAAAAAARTVTEARAGRPGEVRIRLEGVSDREEAQALEGLWVLGETADLEPLAEGEWYWYEVVGCRVQADDGTPIGVVREIWETGAHDVLVVAGEDGRTRLLPAAETFLKEVDIRERRIVIEVISGLLDPA